MSFIIQITRFFQTVELLICLIDEYSIFKISKFISPLT